MEPRRWKFVGSEPGNFQVTWEATRDQAEQSAPGGRGPAAGRRRLPGPVTLAIGAEVRNEPPRRQGSLDQIADQFVQGVIVDSLGTVVNHFLIFFHSRTL